MYGEGEGKPNGPYVHVDVLQLYEVVVQEGGGDVVERPRSLLVGLLRKRETQTEYILRKQDSNGRISFMRHRQLGAFQQNYKFRSGVRSRSPKC